MKRTLMMTTAMVLVSGTIAMAAVTGQGLGEKYRAQGFDYVEVRVGPSQIKVEAYRNGQEVETIYDRATGNVLEREIYSFDGNPNATGLRIRNSDRDFLDDNDGTDGIDGPSDNNDGPTNNTDGIDGPSDNTDGPSADTDGPSANTDGPSAASDGPSANSDGDSD